MLIVGFGKIFTVHDQVLFGKNTKYKLLNQVPKQLSMRTSARAAMETNEDTYWLIGDTPTQSKINIGTVGTN